LRRAGYHLKVRPDLLAFHEGGGAPQATSARVLRAYKNRWLLLRKHGKLRRPELVRALVLLRLRAEWLARERGTMVPDRWTGEAPGRRALIGGCVENYRW